MLEMSDTGEHHGDAKLISLLDGILVTDAASWLDNGCHTVLCSESYSIVKWKESIGCEDETVSETSVLRLVEGDVSRTYTVGLTSTDSDSMTVPDDCDSVGLDMLDDLPSEIQVSHLVFCWLDLGHAHLWSDLLYSGIKLLDEHAAVDRYILLLDAALAAHVDLEESEVLLGGQDLECTL